MRDLKFDEAWFDPPNILQPEALRSDSLKPILTTFNRNMQRTHMMVRTMPWLFGRAQLHIRALMLGKMKIQKPVEPDIFDTKVPADQWQKILRFINDTIKDFNAKDENLEKRSEELYNHGAFHFLGAIKHDLGGAHEFAESSLAFMLLNSWSAFEIMATDLWIVGVNNGDEQFAWNICGKGPKGKSFTLSELEPYLGDLRRNIGTLLVEAEKVRMDSFSHLSDNYGKAFGERLVEAFQLHKATPANVLALESIRNLLMHRGNEVDESCETQLAKAVGCSIPEVKSLKEGDLFEVTGAIARPFVESVLEFGAQLIRTIDSLLSP